MKKNKKINNEDLKIINNDNKENDDSINNIIDSNSSDYFMNKTKEIINEKGNENDKKNENEIKKINQSIKEYINNETGDLNKSIGKSIIKEDFKSIKNTSKIDKPTDEKNESKDKKESINNNNISIENIDEKNPLDIKNEIKNDNNNINKYIFSYNQNIINPEKNNNNKIDYPNYNNKINNDNNNTNYKFDDLKLKFTNTENITINCKNNENLENELYDKIKWFIYLIEICYKEEFFNRLVLYYLYKENINLNNEELISLLKLGKINSYQRILNKSLKLFLTNNDYQDKNISFKDWIKKFVKKKNLGNDEEIVNQYNEYIENKNVEKKIEDKKKYNNIINENKKEIITNDDIISLENINDENENITFKNLKEKNLDLNENKNNNKILKNILSIRNQKFISKKLLIPYNLNVAYNLIKQTKKSNKELHREFKDEMDKF